MTLSIEEAYSTLGVTRDASAEEVKKAYRKLALQFHPDKNSDPAATAQFQQLSAAYKRVDDHLQRGPRAHGFEDLFGDGFQSEHDDDEFDFGDGLGPMPTMEEMLFMFDMLFGGPPPPANRRERRRMAKKGGGVRVNIGRRGGHGQGFPSYMEQEFMDMFAHGMMFDDDLSEDEFEAFFGRSGMGFAAREDKKPKKKKAAQPDEEMKPSAAKASPTTKKNRAKKSPKPSPTIGSKVCINGKYAGVVKFTGHVHYAKGEFVGVELSSPVGKNDGSIKGVRYFECSPSHGLMVRPNDVTLTA